MLGETLKSGLLAEQLCRDNVILKAPEADSKIDANLPLKVALRNHWLYDCNTQGLNEACLLSESCAHLAWYALKTHLEKYGISYPLEKNPKHLLPSISKVFY